jgi:AcrR family transcriptional regulator
MVKPTSSLFTAGEAAVPSDAVARIRAAAERHFAQHGYAGARVDEIAAAAGVNKAALYYHVGDKRALYHAVLADVLGRMADAVERNIGAAHAPRDKLRAHIATLADTVGAHSHLAPIMMREVASGGAQLPDEALRHMLRVVGALRTVLEEGIANGAFRAVDPFMTHILIVGGIMFYVAGAPIRARAATLGSGAVHRSGQVPMAKAIDAVTDLVLNGLSDVTTAANATADARVTLPQDGPAVTN